MNQYRSFLFVVIFAKILFVVGCERIPEVVVNTEPAKKIAIANITAIDGSDLTGTATFSQIDSGVHTVIEITNAKPGLHATHLHIGSSCSDIGAHWHPMGVPAGTVGIPVAEATIDTPPIGIGEIGNIPVSEDGIGVLEFTTPFWSIGGMPDTDILGKLILIHETGDTFQTSPHAHGSMMTNTETNTGMHTHTIVQTETAQTTHVCTLAVLGQQIDLEKNHHLPEEAQSPHSHDLLEILLNCFVEPEQLANPAILSSIPLVGTPAHQAFLDLEPKNLAAYHEFFISTEIPVHPDFFIKQYRLAFSIGHPEDFEEEMQKRLTHLYITSGIDIENPADLDGYGMLLTMFLDDRTTSWVLGYFQGEDTAFGDWIVDVLTAIQVRSGGGARVGCGVIGLMG